MFVALPGTAARRLRILIFWPGPLSLALQSPSFPPTCFAPVVRTASYLIERGGTPLSSGLVDFTHWRWAFPMSPPVPFQNLGRL